MTAIPASIAARKPNRPAPAGTVAWVNPPRRYGTPALQGGLRINGVLYDLVELLDDDQARVGWSLAKHSDRSEVYVLDTTFGPAAADWGCTCPHRHYRQRVCKHALALHAALAALGGAS